MSVAKMLIMGLMWLACVIVLIERGVRQIRTSRPAPTTATLPAAKIADGRGFADPVDLSANRGSMSFGVILIACGVVLFALPVASVYGMYQWAASLQH